MTKSVINFYALLGMNLILLPMVVQAQPRVQWLQTYSHFESSFMRDVYLKSDGGLAMCGLTEFRRSFWIINADRNGNVIFENTYTDPDGPEVQRGFARSIIETDAGGFVAGGNLNGDIAVVNIDGEGELIWFSEFGPDPGTSDCRAVIELKSGNFAIAGYAHSNNNRDGYLAVIDQEGNLVWENTYGENDLFEEFVALREVEDEGMVAFGNKRAENSDFWLVKVDFNGDIIWERVYQSQVSEWGTGMTSCQGGFALAGNLGEPEQYNDIYLKRVDREGGEIYSQTYEMADNNDLSECRGICKMPDDGFILFGLFTRAISAFPGLIVRTNAGGNELWRMDHLVRGDRGWTRFDSAISLPGGEIVIVGDYHDSDGVDTVYAFATKFFPESTAPEFVRWNPLDGPQSVLPGDSTLFSAFAIDPDDDSLMYFWILNEDTVGWDTIFTLTTGDREELELRVNVSDGLLEDNLIWHVTVTDLYISDHSPDTLNLNLRRGSSQDFSVETRAVEGDLVEYAWTLTEQGAEPLNVGSESDATLQFNRSGIFSLEAYAFRGEASDVVNWNISVRGAIWSFWPEDLSLNFEPDTTVNFGVLPFNPDSDSLSYEWFFDGEQISTDSTTDIRFPDQEGLYEVTCITRDGVESDTITWQVTITRLAVEQFQTPNSKFQITAVPNPFNSMTTIRFSLESAQSAKSADRLTVHDLTGRLVHRFDTRSPDHSTTRTLVWNASDLPAGVYLLRLESSGRTAVQKLVLMR